MGKEWTIEGTNGDVFGLLVHFVLLLHCTASDSQLVERSSAHVRQLTVVRRLSRAASPAHLACLQADLQSVRLDSYAALVLAICCTAVVG